MESEYENALEEKFRFSRPHHEFYGILAESNHMFTILSEKCFPVILLLDLKIKLLNFPPPMTIFIH